MRHGIIGDDGLFSNSSGFLNTILHKEIRVGHRLPAAALDANVFEHRQTPHNFGLGLIDAIDTDTIIANEDPDDADGDGISGRAHRLADGRLGRFGWKAQIPSVAEFVGDAMAAELGVTVPVDADLAFAIVEDGDGVADPELSMDEVADITFFLSALAGPPRQLPTDAEALAVVEQGARVFSTIGCAKCHIPSLPGALGDVPLFSDLLLHETMRLTIQGIVDADAGQREFRTPPLWGLAKTAPYMHDGRADNVEQAIFQHDGEAATSREAFRDLNLSERRAVIRFLNSL